MSRADRRIRRRPRWATLPLLLGSALLLGQQDCNESPPPRGSPSPLALDCVIAGNDVSVPLEPVLAPDRPFLTAWTGTLVDVSLTARLPADFFCALQDAGYSQVDLGSATATVSLQGVLKPEPPEVVLTAAGLPLTAIDTAMACGGSLGPEVVVDFPPVTSVPWADGASTVDFLLTVEGLDFLLTNTLVGGPSAADVSLTSLCEPSDRSEPPNAVSTDPDDSPRIAADTDADGIYESLAQPVTHQAYMNVNGYCLGYPCEDNNPCTIDECQPRNYGRCSYTNAPDGTACDDGGTPGTCQAGVCQSASDPFCGSSTPLAVSDLNYTGFSVHAASDGSEVTLTNQAAGLFQIDPATLASSASAFVPSTVRPDSVAYSLPQPPSSIFVNQTSGRFSSIDTATWSVAFTRTLARSACSADTLSPFPSAFHPYALASPAFQGTYAGDLIYVGTFYGTSATCTTGHTTDNRVYALDGATGIPEWIFNVSAAEDVDRVAGMVLDRGSDRLYFTTERTSSLQDSVWALDVLTGTKVWSTNAGRIQTPPVLSDGSLYVATVTGDIKAIDPNTGVELWSETVGSIPLVEEISAARLASGKTLVATVDLFGQIIVVEDLGGSSQLVAAFQLPNGAPASSTPSSPPVQAVSRILMDGNGRGLVGADDGKVYPLDLLPGTVGAPLSVGTASASVDYLVHEPVGLFGSPVSFLVGTSEGVVARYCTTLGAPIASADFPGAGSLSLLD